MHFWLASPTTVWNLDSPTVINASRYVYLLSWALVANQLLALDHLELFGLTQVSVFFFFLFFFYGLHRGSPDADARASPVAHQDLPWL